MANFINVSVDVEKVQEALKGTSKSIKAISRKAMSIIGHGAVKAIKGGIRDTLNKRTGQLLKAYKYYGFKSGTGGIVRTDKKIPNGDDFFKKTYTLNYGYTGNVRRALNKPHSFVERGEEYVNSSGYMSDIEKMVDKELEKWWG